MQSKISLKELLIVVGIGGIAFSSIMAFDLLGQDSSPRAVLPGISQAPEKFIDEEPPESVQSVTLEEEVIFGLPARLKIPKINVDAVVEYVGITSLGVMDVPKEPDKVAWLLLGPRPGEIGSAVISGHYGWKNSIPAVFDNLHKLAEGDNVYVEDEKGATSTFVVREIRTYGENEDALDVFSSSDGRVHLNLITCEGVWSEVKKSYSQRLVVFTTLSEEEE